MTYWAIRWLPLSGRGSGYIDNITIRSTRRGAWAAHQAAISEHATPHWLAEIKRRRRNGFIKAVKIEIKEIQ